MTFIAPMKWFCTGTMGELAGATDIDKKIVGEARRIRRR